jgi:hypothetical protein
VEDLHWWDRLLGGRRNRVNPSRTLQRRQHVAARLPEDVSRHRGELEPRILENFMDAVVPETPGFKLLTDSGYQEVPDLTRARGVRGVYAIFMRRGWANANGKLLS